MSALYIILVSYSGTEGNREGEVGGIVMGTRDGAWTGVRCRRSGFLFWVRLVIEIVRIDRNRTDRIGSHFLVK